MYMIYFSTVALLCVAYSEAYIMLVFVDLVFGGAWRGKGDASHVSTEPVFVKPLCAKRQDLKFILSGSRS